MMKRLSSPCELVFPKVKFILIFGDFGTCLINVYLFSIIIIIIIIISDVSLF